MKFRENKYLQRAGLMKENYHGGLLTNKLIGNLNTK